MSPGDGWGILLSKVRPPRPRDDALGRSELIERLLAASDRSLVLISAAAGYGKTTLARQWVDVDTRDLAWLTLDAEDNDPVVLLRDVVFALEQIEQLRDTAAVLSSQQLDLHHVALPLLATELGEERAPFVLVLDDVHLVTHPDAVDLAHHFLDAVPDRSQVVLVGRSLDAFHMARQRLDDTTLVIEPSDLAFTEQESRAVLRHSLPDLSPPAVDHILEQVEGWPAGLQLAILGLREHPDPAEAVASAQYLNRYVTEYFRDEFLRYLPDDVRSFLVRSSILDRLSGPLCDAVLDEVGSGAYLRSLAASSGNPFVTTSDDDPEWFVYHHLFRDLLIAELHVDAPELEQALRRRAAIWLAEHERDDAAITQSIGTHDVTFASEILYRRLFDTLTSGRTASLQRWLELFSPEQRRRNALLALSAGWLAATTGQVEENDHWLEVLDAAQWDGSLPDDTVSFAVAHAALRMTSQRGGVKQVVEEAAVVLEAGPEGSPWWPLARLMGAVNAHAMGGVVDPVAHFDTVEFATRGNPVIHGVALAHLALAHFSADDRAKGHALAQDATDELERHGLSEFGMVPLVHCVRALSAALRGEPDESRSAAELGLRLQASMNEIAPRAAIHFRLVLGESALLRGDYEEVSDLLAGAQTFLPLEPDAALLIDWADEQRERLERRTAVVAAGHDLTPAEMRVLEELPSHQSLAEIGDRLYVTRNTVKSHTVAIYRKLGVSTRAAAVDRARELGLFPG